MPPAEIPEKAVEAAAEAILEVSGGYTHSHRRDAHEALRAVGFAELLAALRPIVDAIEDDPGTSDLDDEQPVSITLGDVRRIRGLMDRWGR